MGRVIDMWINKSHQYDGCYGGVKKICGHREGGNGYFSPEIRKDI